MWRSWAYITEEPQRVKCDTDSQVNFWESAHSKHVETFILIIKKIVYLFYSGFMEYEVQDEDAGDKNCLKAFK